jgi:hypothetical protein
MPKLSAGLVSDHIMALLPPDGTPVLNRVMRLMLSRGLGQTVTEELYDQARSLLLDNGRIGRLRGQGGQIFLDKSDAGALAEPTSAEEIGILWSEQRLMPHLRRYLDGPFKKGLDIPKSGVCVIEDTSKMGPARGRWARPDFILVSAMRFELMPGAQVDVHSFELKTETGATDLAVYEALAQTRFTHFGHLVWHLPARSSAEARLQEITEQCDEHGIGLIRVYDPDDIENYEIVLDPLRKATPPSVVDGFLDLRLDGTQRGAIKRVINGASQ